jgi:hypothetical protein
VTISVAPERRKDMIRKAGILVAGAALLVISAGCGKAPPPPIVEVEGIVRLDGRPLKKVEVRFVPTIDQGGEYVATGVTNDAGEFKLTCKGQPGACACENRVLVMEAELPGHLKSESAQVDLARYFRSLGGRPLPPQYGNLAESPITVNVRADQKEYNIDLTR